MPVHKEYRAQWVSAGYHSKMGSAWVTPPPPPNLMRAYYFTSAEFAVSNIALSRIKVARFSDVNDPFELLGLNFGVKGVRQSLRKLKDEHNSHTGLISFSQNWTNPVLWSHYAAKHKGICLGFNVPRDALQAVQYEDERILSALDKFGDPNKIAPALQDRLKCTKSSHWQYEQEVRMFVPLEKMKKEGAIYFCPFSHGLRLAEVILGTECDTDLSAVRTLAAKHYGNVAVIKARLAFKFFAIVPDERTIP